MGAMMERSGIAERLFEAVHLWTRRLPGGLAIGTVIMCVIFAASTGVIGATETVVGLLAIPGMMRYNYSKPLISGVICAGGSLGTIIPPSVVVVVLGPVANVSIGDLLVGMVFPGLILALSYIVYIVVICIVRPETAPRIPDSEDDPALREKLLITLKALVPPVLMIVAVLGSIIAGIAEPTAAAAVGALASFLLTVIYGRLTWSTLRQALLKTIIITAMIMFILMAGSIFTGVFVAMGGMSVMRELIGGLSLDPWTLLLLFLGLIFVAGFFLEWISIILIFIPIFMPFVIAAGFDPVWFCMLVLLIIQTSYLTPPMAPAIFYLRGVAPAEITIKHMYLGVVPFIIMQFITLGVVMAFPQLVLWLPSKLLGFN
jgi:tripartite ATP-independent transporter DctM subunit